VLLDTVAILDEYNKINDMVGLEEFSSDAIRWIRFDGPAKAETSRIK